MDHTTLEDAIGKVLQSELVYDQVEFIWHAGEPLVAGLPFFERSVELIEKYNTRDIAVLNSIQTNGTLINDSWCRFFSRNNFGVGISIDGPAFLHDRRRVNWAGLGSHRAAMRGFALLKSQGLAPGAICVLTRESLRHPEEIFSFFLENGFEYVAFNLEEVENVHAVSSVCSTDAAGRPSVVEEYRDFVSRLYDVWRPHAGTINVREFRDLFASFKSILTDNEYCARPLETADIGIITIQKNGDITAFSPEFAGGASAQFGNFVVGNIREGSLASILENDVFLRMRDDIREGVKNCEGSCLYFALCGGAFTSNKYFENGSLKSTETVTCRLHLQALASVLLEKLAVRRDFPQRAASTTPDRGG